MATFGQFETVREVHRSGLKAVWTARRAGSNDEAVFAGVLCEPDPEITGHDAAAQAVESFLDQAGVQRKAASGGGGHWAPVHDAGLQENGAFLVTDLFPRSAERLTLSRVRTDAATLRHVAGSIAAGLRELHSALSRPHGNLRATNVLIGPGEWAQARVALCDPLSTRSVKHAKAGADQRALGELIYELVLHQPYRGAFPVADSPEWAGLGRTRAGWLALCNRLLDPHHAEGVLPLADLESTIAGLVPAAGGRKTVFLVGAAAALLLVVAAVVWFVWLGRADPSRAPDLARWAQSGEANWKQLCRDWRDVEPFLGALAEPAPEPVPGVTGAPATRADWYASADERLRDAVAAWSAARRENGASPRDIAEASRRTDMDSLSLSPPRLVQSPAGMDKTERLLRVIGTFETATSAEGGVPDALQARATEFHARRWTVLAEALRSAADAATGGDWSERVASLDAAIGAAARAKRLEARAAAVDAIGSRLLASGDDVVARYAAWSKRPAMDAAQRGLPITQAIDAFDSAVLAGVEQLGTRLAEAMESRWSLVDQECLRRTSRVYTHGAGLDPGDALAAWLTDVASDQFTRPLPADDPAASWAGATPTTTVRADFAEFRADIRDEPDEKVHARLAELEARIAATEAAANEVRGLPWGACTKAEKQRRAGEVVASAEAAHKEVSAYINEYEATYVSSRNEALEKLRTEPAPVTDSAALAAVWAGWRDALVRDIESGTPFRQVIKRSNAAREALVAVQHAIPAAPTPGDAGRASNSALAAFAAERREAALAEAFVARAQPPTVENAPALAAAFDTVARSYGELSSGLTALASGSNAVETLLDQGHMLAEALLGGGTLGDRAAEIEASPVYAQAPVRAALAPVVARIEKLREIEGLKSPADLTRALRAACGTPQRPEAARTAWRGLASLAAPAWPQGVDQLRESLALRDDLRRVFGGVGPEERRGALNAELDRSLRDRWAAAAVTMTTPAELKSAFGLMADFGVAVEHVTDPRLAYDLLINELEPLIASRGPGAGPVSDDPTLTRWAAERLGRLPASGSPLASNERVAALRETLAAVARGDPIPDAQVGRAELGPGTAGWEIEDVGGEGERLRFTPPAGAANVAPLDFVRLAVEGGPPVFLCTTETPVGLVLGLASAADHRAALAALLPSPEQMNGPSTWARAGSNLRLSTTWLDKDALDKLASSYSELRAPIGEVLTGRSEPAFPFQQAPPGAAVYVARALGCRLPTAAEWRAAAQREGAPIAPGRWNLRDAAWETTHNGLAAILTSKSLETDTRLNSWFPWPDRGAYLPQAFRPGGGGVQVGVQKLAVPRGSTDGVALFAPVGSDVAAAPAATFHHIIGNVAEFVTQAPIAESEWPAATIDAVPVFVAARFGVFRVIGGSALSAEQVGEEAPHEIDDDVSGYSDVGFRLAFDAEGYRRRPRNYAEWIASALGKTPYLMP
ncbi:MAG: hypothetical protein ACKVU4_13865 [Phycisphaerales bacterium]